MWVELFVADGFVKGSPRGGCGRDGGGGGGTAGGRNGHDDEVWGRISEW